MIIFQDGTAYSCRNNLRITISPSGYSCQINDASYLVHTTPKKYHKHLIQLLDFRNSILTPYLPKSLYSNLPIFTKRNRILGTRWPINHTAIQKIQSLDGLVTIELLPHLKLFKASFPVLLVDQLDNRITDTQTFYSYTIISQIHTVSDPPYYWIHPLSILLKNNQKILDDFQWNKSTVKAANPLYVSEAIPVVDQTNLSPAHSINVHFAIDDMSKKPILLMDSDGKTFRSITMDNQVTIEIMLDTHSILILDSDFKFFTVFNNEESVYFVEGCPDHISNTMTNEKYNIKNILATALTIYQVNISNICHTQDDQFTQYCSLINTNNYHKGRLNDKEVNQSIFSKKFWVVNGVASCNIQNNRFYCTFVDNTLINIPLDYTMNSLAEVMDADGTEICVRISNPIGYERYVLFTLNQLKWNMKLTEEDVIASEMKYTDFKDKIRASKLFYNELNMKLGSNDTEPESISKLLLNIRRRNTEFLSNN
ncbi:hypothetical protein BC833DRAFT_653359 [Globomyces pollinis-pini]|nr:hypothetical protein BC833DRAFT_653359 [Globomyces pollinis-pini]